MYPLFAVCLFVLKVGELGEWNPVSRVGLSRHMLGRPIDIGNFAVRVFFMAKTMECFCDIPGMEISTNPLS